MPPSSRIRCVLFAVFVFGGSAAIDDIELFDAAAGDGETHLSRNEADNGARAYKSAKSRGLSRSAQVPMSGFEGDIGRTSGRMLDAGGGTADRLNAALTDKTGHWPQAKVPYTLSAKLREKARLRIAQAVAQFHEETCIEFVPRTDQRDYLHITVEQSVGGCSSDVGLMGGRQQLFLSDSRCFEPPGVIVHELMHAVGFYHEQARSDRDKYVEVRWSNIDARLDNNFLRYDDFQVSTLQTPYDFDSIMHYPPNAFSKNGEPTIVPRPRGVRIGQRDRLSPFDIYELNRLYDCPGRHAMPPTPSYALTESTAASGSGGANSCGASHYDPVSQACCGSTVYTFGEAVCCSGSLSPMPPRTVSFRVECCGSQPVTPPLTCCGGAVLNATAYLCCGNRALAKQHRYSICCGSRMIDASSQGCCAGRAYNQYTQECCGKRIISTSTHICCGEKAYAAETSSCCRSVNGKELRYDHRTQSCCGQTALDDATIFNPDTHHCCEHAVVRRRAGGVAACCGPAAYDMETQLCCRENVIPKHTSSRDNDYCCGSEAVDRSSDEACCAHEHVYDYATEGCCNGRVFSLASGQRCCGLQRERLYSTSTHSCHNHAVLALPQGEGTLQYCADSPYRDETHDCCGDTTVFEKGKGLCCDHVYNALPRGANPANYECCGTEILDESDRQKRCCRDRAIYHVDTELCCFTQVVAKPRNLKGTAACCDTGVAYDTFEQYCCDDKLTPLPNARKLSDVHCCGAVSYNRFTHGCCDGHLDTFQGFTLDMSDCCRSVLMDSSKQVCCEGVVNERPPSWQYKTSCCGTKMYNFETHGCCEERVVRLPSGVSRSNLGCCAGRPFNGRKLGCCAGRTFDLDSKRCCDGRMRSVTRASSAYACCGDHIYLRASQDCCLGNRVCPKI